MLDQRVLAETESDTKPPTDEARAARLASFDPTIAALVLASPPIDAARRDRIRAIFGAVAR